MDSSSPKINITHHTVDNNNDNTELDDILKESSQSYADNAETIIKVTNQPPKVDVDVVGDDELENMVSAAFDSNIERKESADDVDETSGDDNESSDYGDDNEDEYDSRVSYDDAKIEEIELSKIFPNPHQPRRSFDEETLQELADSISAHGVIQPLVVTKTLAGYELVIGERRYRASQLAGLETIPAIVKTSMENQKKLEIALIENIQREDLNTIEEALAYKTLIDEFYLTQEEISTKVGKRRSSIANILRLLNLPAEIQRGVIDGKITGGHARALLGVPDIEQMLKLYKVVVDHDMNVRQVEEKVKELSTRKPIEKDKTTRDPKIVAFETELRSTLGTQVKIQKSGRGGKIMIEFFSDEELDKLIQLMGDESGNKSSDYFVV